MTMAYFRATPQKELGAGINMNGRGAQVCLEMHKPKHPTSIAKGLNRGRFVVCSATRIKEDSARLTEHDGYVDDEELSRAMLATRFIPSCALDKGLFGTSYDKIDKITFTVPDRWNLSYVLLPGLY